MNEKILFLIISGLMSAIGLDTNNNTMIIGSMLISPFSLPFLKFIKNIFDQKYNNFSLLVEVIIFIIVSFLIGFIYGKIHRYNVPNVKTINNMNQEIDKLTNTTYYLHAFIYSIISGIVIYLSFNKMKNSYNLINLVGVSVGLSILPPLVNSGMLFSRNNESDYIKSLTSVVESFDKLGQVQDKGLKGLNQYKDIVQNPAMYSSPRSVKIGIVFQF
jgi:uncharacterized membrane protein